MRGCIYTLIVAGARQIRRAVSEQEEISASADLQERRWQRLQVSSDINFGISILLTHSKKNIFSYTVMSSLQSGLTPSKIIENI